MAVFAILIGLYPAVYFLTDERIALLAMKSEELLASTWWMTAFYMHIVFGGTALFIGWIQFFPAIRNKHLTFHRITGMIYLVMVLLGGLSGIILGVFASGGPIAKTGFVALGIGWVYTSSRGFTAIRNHQVTKHESFMIFSYALCFAAVTLRLWMPLLTSLTGSFFPAYQIVAWLCWVPNLFVAYWIVERKNRRLHLT